MNKLTKIGIIAAIAGAYVAWKNRNKFKKIDPKSFKEDLVIQKQDPAQIMAIWLSNSQ